MKKAAMMTLLVANMFVNSALAMNPLPNHKELIDNAQKAFDSHCKCKKKLKITVSWDSFSNANQMSQVVHMLESFPENAVAACEIGGKKMCEIETIEIKYGEETKLELDKKTHKLMSITNGQSGNHLGNITDYMNHIFP
ncbi:MAG: hypothetical protein AB7K41_11650 [Bdellovibrionales bacterium]